MGLLLVLKSLILIFIRSTNRTACLSAFPVSEMQTCHCAHLQLLYQFCSVLAPKFAFACNALFAVLNNLIGHFSQEHRHPIAIPIVLSDIMHNAQTLEQSRKRLLHLLWRMVIHRLQRFTQGRQIHHIVIHFITGFFDLHHLPHSKILALWHIPWR